MDRLFVLTLLLFTLPVVSVMAQEGEPIDPVEEVETEVILEHEIDSAQIELAPEEVKPRTNSVFFLNGVKLTTSAPADPSEKSTSAEKPRAVATKSSYNFLYYLFFKSKKSDYKVD